jgi:hypothetical protein
MSPEGAKHQSSGKPKNESEKCSNDSNLRLLAMEFTYKDGI